MKTEIAKFLTEKGFSVKDDKFFATIKGYHFNGSFKENSYFTPLTLHVSFFATRIQQQTIASALSVTLGKQISVVATDYGMKFIYNNMSVKELLRILPFSLDYIPDVLAKEGALDCRYCPICGTELKPEEQRLLSVDGIFVALDEHCRANYAVTEVSAETQSDIPNNYAKGIVGALAGSLIGAVITFFATMYIGLSFIISIVSLLLATALYKKMGGKPNNVMIAVSGCFTVVFQLLACLAAYVIAAHDAFGQTSDIWQSFMAAMMIQEFSAAFYLGFILNLLFSIGSIVVYLFIYKRKKSRSVL